jgi:hypothetical protein
MFYQIEIKTEGAWSPSVSDPTSWGGVQYVVKALTHSEAVRVTKEGRVAYEGVPSKLPENDPGEPMPPSMEEIMAIVGKPSKHVSSVREEMLPLFARTVTQDAPPPAPVMSEAQAKRIIAAVRVVLAQHPTGQRHMEFFESDALRDLMSVGAFIVRHKEDYIVRASLEGGTPLVSVEHETDGSPAPIFTELLQKALEVLCAVGFPTQKRS